MGSAGMRATSELSKWVGRADNQAKVTHFLRLKDEQGEHINTRLLGSSAFANPRIYSQLVSALSHPGAYLLLATYQSK